MTVNKLTGPHNVFFLSLNRNLSYIKMQPLMMHPWNWLYMSSGLDTIRQIPTYCRTQATETVLDGGEDGEGVGMKESLSGLTG